MKSLQTIFPTNYNDNIVEIDTDKFDTVYIRFDKNDELLRTVKELAYSWSSSRSQWYKHIDGYTESVVDTVSEVSHKFLSLGYGVFIKAPFFQEVKEKVVTGSYKEEQMRWIIWDYDSGKLGVFMKKLDRSVIDVVKTIGSYSSYANIYQIPLEKYKYAEDFAMRYGFAFSHTAKAKIEEFAKASLDRIEVSKKDVFKQVETLDNGGIESDLIDD